jgi:ribosomal protein S18 acetylase RimI-like enzyme
LITIRRTTADDWTGLKAIRLAALLDSPTAFGVSYESAAAYTDEQWRTRAAGTQTVFWLAFQGSEAVGMIAGAVSQKKRYNLIGMWVAPPARGSGAAAQLVDAVKSHAVQQGYDRVFLDVAPENLRAARFYQNQGFVFIDEWEPLASHPHIQVQTMVWKSPVQAAFHAR